MWVYRQGDWLEEDFTFKDWEKNKIDDLSEWLKVNEFSPHNTMSWGIDDSPAITFHRHSKKEIWFCDCDPGEYSCFFFIIPDFPSLLMFRKEYGCCFDTNDPLCTEIKNLRRALTKDD